MKSKLILVEGIPGTGKSTTARYVAGWLAEKGLQTHLHLEGEPSHPADPDGLAFLEENQFLTLLDAYSAHNYRIQQEAVKKHGGYIVNYRGLDKEERLPDDLFETLSSYDIYATLPPEKYRQVALSMWQAFVSQADLEEGVYIFECCFLQNPYTVLMGQHNCSPDAVHKHIAAVTDAIEPLYPLLVYLDAGDVRKIFQNAIASRPKAWIDFVTEYVTGQGYGKAHGLEGREGVFKFYERMKGLMEDALEALNIPHIHADVVAGDWDAVHGQIAEFLLAETGYWPPER